MNLLTRMHLLLLLLLTAPMTAFAQQTPCESGDADVANADGSRLRIRTLCAEGGGPRFELLSASRGGKDFVAMPDVGPVDPDEDMPSRAYFVDLDKDGDHEIVTRGMCGAGPNCMGEIYRWDRRAGKLYRFLSDGWADLSIVDGHLVTAGRASCCAWVFRAYRWDAGPVSSDQEDLSIDVQAQYGEQGDEPDEILCTFSRRTGDATRVVPPPSPAWLTFCETYGEPYHVVTADESAAPSNEE